MARAREPAPPGSLHGFGSAPDSTSGAEPITTCRTTEQQETCSRINPVRRSDPGAVVVHRLPLAGAENAGEEQRYHAGDEMEVEVRVAKAGLDGQ